MFAGLRATCAAGTAAYSAYAPTALGNPTRPKTSSPTAKPSTPGPTASTTPEMSQPRMTGGSTPRLFISPPLRRVFQSTGLIPAASTRTSSSPSPASGRGTSSKRSSSGSPH